MLPVMAQRVRFLVNLRAETTSNSFSRAVRPAGWLLPPAYASLRVREFAAREAARGLYVLADDGLYDDISRLAVAHAPSANAVASQIRLLRDSKSAPVRQSDIPEALRRRARTIGRAIEQDTSALFAGHLQRSMDLAALRVAGVVAAEDPAPAVAFRIGIGPEAVGASALEWRRIARKVARATLEDIEAVPPEVDCFAVASPQDAASARYFADEFARAGINFVAMPFGAFMAEQDAGSSILIGRREVHLPTVMPLAYVNSVMALREFLRGYEARAGKPVEHLHLLGLGSPIVIGLAALLAAKVPTITIDATSPLHDASFGKLYSNSPTFIKLNPDSVARRILRDRRLTGWSCHCPSCRAFHDAFPQDAGAARVAWRAAGMPADLTAELVQGRPIGDALPLLSTSSPKGARGRAARAARVGHNHWSLTGMCATLSERVQEGTIREYMSDVVEAYSVSATPRFAAAVRWSLDQASADE